MFIRCHLSPSRFRRIACSFGCVFGCALGCSDGPVNKQTAAVAPETIVSTTAQGSAATTTSDDGGLLVFVEQMRPQVDAFCGDCHVTPKPGNIDRGRWPREVLQGFEFYRVSGRHDLHPPSVEDVTKYFVSQAPETLTMPASIVGNPFSATHFEPSNIFKPISQTVTAQLPCVSFLKWMNLESSGGKSLVYCDLGTGTIYAYQPQAPGAVPKPIAVLFQPAKFAPCDLNGDERTDLVVADLGEFAPADSDLGRIVWLKRRESGDQFDSVVLQDGLGRVADVSPADFDGDGDIDILVAEFGWRKTGRILMLENQGAIENEEPKFELKVLDNRHGAMELPVVDLNGDGQLDFVVLFSQEFEVVEAFINRGHGEFEKQVLFRADDPTYGSARIELADVDGDGDQDVVYANGDTFDTGSKPYHSVQWLENQGAFPFQHHHITFMPGVLAIKLADFDNDGDLDIIAGALVPTRLEESLESAGVESFILLEQTSPSQFKRTKLETSDYYHGAIETGDFDGDGRVDIAVGNFLHFNPTLPARHDFTIWKNLGQR